MVSGLEIIRRGETAPTISYARPAAAPFSYTDSGGIGLDSIGIAAGAAGVGATDSPVIWLTFVRSLPRTCGEGRVLLRGAMYEKFRECYNGMDESGLQALQNMIPFCGFRADEVTLFNAFTERLGREHKKSMCTRFAISLVIISVLNIVGGVFLGRVLDSTGVADQISAIFYVLGAIVLAADAGIVFSCLNSYNSAVMESDRLEEEYATRHGLVLVDNG
jgi:hypothetical protein